LLIADRAASVLYHRDVFIGPGTLHAGESLMIDGSLSFSSASHFVAGVGRTANDHLSVGGATSLAGELMIEISNDIPVGSTDSFTILASGLSLSGSFSNVAAGGRLVSGDGHGSFSGHLRRQ
jgi:hypothetical protein